MTLSLAATPASGQTTGAGKRFDHDKLYKAASKAPLIKVVLKTADGKDLTEAQKKDIAQSRELMTAAEAALAEGRIGEAVNKSAEALRLRRAILPPEHHLTVSSRVLAAEYNRWAALSPAKQKKLTAALKRVASSAELYELGDYEAAQDAAAGALAVFEETLSQDHVATCEALLQLGKAQTDRSLLAEALRSLARALRIAEQFYGEDHPATARVLDRVGWLGIHLASQGTFDGSMMKAAASQMRRAQGIFEAAYGEGRASAEALDNLGTALRYLNSPDRALEAKLRALYVREQVLGPEDKDTGVSFSNLAWLYSELGQSDRVIPLRRRALAIFDKQLVAHHPYRVLEMGNLARDLQASGKLTEAIGMWRALGELDKQQGIEGTPEAIHRRLNLASAHVAAGDVADGAKVFVDVFGLIEQLHSRGEQGQAIRALDRIPAVCLRYRMYADGLPYLEQLVAWLDASSDKRDGLLAGKRRIRLGTIYVQLGRLEDAKRVMSEGVARIEAIKGKGSLEVASPMLSLSLVLEDLGELDASEAMCEQILQVIEKKLGRNVGGAAYTLMQMGRLSALRKQFGMAEFSLNESQAIFDKLIEQDLNANIRILHELANLSALRGDRKQAVEQLRSALALCRQASQAGNSTHVEAILAKTLRELLEASDAADAALKNERQAWRDEFAKLLKSLEARRALSAEEKGWLAALP